MRYATKLLKVLKGGRRQEHNPLTLDQIKQLEAIFCKSKPKWPPRALELILSGILELG